MPNKKNVYVAIMAGGIGSRFWPYSRVQKPKQFLDVLNTGKTLIQITFSRFKDICPVENIYVVTNEDYVDLVKEQLPELGEDQILAEPIKRNTAPCIAYVSQKIYKKNKLASIIVSPSDHLVLNQKEFERVIQKSITHAEENDVLITMGIKPTRPDSGYGYIQHEDIEEEGFYKVKAFTEKPDMELAKTFIKSGDFLWNSGTFVWRASQINEAMEKYLPEVYDALANCESSFYTEDEAKAISTAYTRCTSISIDYGVMEKADNVFVIPADYGWSDIGTWASLYEVYEKDYLKNAVKGDTVQIHDGSDNLIVAPNEKLVVINGLNNFCVIDTEDVLLIFEKDREQEVKKITSDLKNKKLDKFL